MAGAATLGVTRLVSALAPSANRLVLGTLDAVATAEYTEPIFHDDVTASASHLGLETPDVATNAGYTELVFHDDFTSMASIDRYATGKGGHLWYADHPWVPGAVTSPDAIDVSDGVLTLDGNPGVGSWGLGTVSPKSGAGRTFQHGYFEARLWFDPSLGPKAAAWPAFWSLPTNQIFGTPAPHHVEIDFFEAYHEPHGRYSGQFSGTVHDVTQTDFSYASWQNTNNAPSSTPLTRAGWHRYGCLWQPGHLTWYLDGVQQVGVAYGADIRPSCEVVNPQTEAVARPFGVFSVADERDARVAIILTAGMGWPLKVDWVRVWSVPPRLKSSLVQRG
jgi:Glycosyl hydrolases family 16